ncbi:Tar (HIV-1) RNA binding protein 1 [Chytriomyces hyalinus]|nr:Tar (HIV-1) RNA binding protein 1 [Chytriomyces hyalinus]
MDHANAIQIVSNPFSHDQVDDTVVDAISALLETYTKEAQIQSTVALFDKCVMVPFWTYLDPNADAENRPALPASTVLAGAAACIAHSSEYLFTQLERIERVLLHASSQTGTQYPQSSAEFIVELLALTIESKTVSESPQMAFSSIVTACVNIAIPDCPTEQPSHLQRTINSAILPLFFQMNALVPTHRELCSVIWTRISSRHITRPSLDDKWMLRSSALTLVHLFNNLFGINPKQEMDTPFKGSSGGKKKFRRKDAKDGIMTGGCKVTQESDKLDWTVYSLQKAHLDLRKDPIFWRIVINGLVSRDSTTEKYSLFLLKRVVDYSTKLEETAAADQQEEEWTEFFAWSRVGEISSLWNDYFIVLDILQESSAHLIEPILPKFHLFTQPSFHVSWWTVLMTRGLSNNSSTVRKRVIEYLVSETDLTRLFSCNGSPGDDFLWRVLIPALDNAYLYHVSGLGSYISPFGEKVRRFIKRIILASGNKVGGRAVTFATRMGCLYIIMGLADASEHVDKHTEADWRVLHANDVMRFRDLMLSERSMSVWTFSNKSVLIFGDVVSVLSVLGTYSVVEGGVSETSAWLESGFGTTSTWFQDNLTLAFREYFRESHGNSSESDQTRARQLVHMLNYLTSALSKQEALAPLLDRCRNIYTSVAYAPTGTLQRIVFILIELKEKHSILFGSAFRDCAQDLLSLFANYLENPSVPSLLALKSHNLAMFYLLLSWRELNISIGEIDSLLAKTVATATERLAHPAMPLQLISSLLDVSLAFNVSLEIPNSSFHTSILVSKLIKMITSDLKHTKELPNNLNWSEILNELQISKYKCMVSIAKRCPMGDNEVFETVLAVCANAISNTSNTAAPIIFEAVTHMLGELRENLTPLALQSLAMIIREGLAVVLENAGNAKHFVALLRGFGKMAFCPTTLFVTRELSDTSDDLRREMEKSFADLSNLSNQRTGVINFVADECFNFWNHSIDETSRMCEVAFSSIEGYTDLFIELLLFGPLRAANVDADRMDAAVSYTLMMPQLEQTWSQSELSDIEGTAERNFNCQDYTIRVKAINILTKLSLENKRHRILANTFLRKLLTIHLSNKYRAKFDSTYEHRMQIRVWCSIQLLIPVCVGDAEMMALLIDSLDIDTLPSTRYYVEWSLLRVMLADPSALSLLWSQLDDFESKSTTIISVFSILVHLSRHLPADMLHNFQSTLFAKITPWLTSNHFTIRIYAQYLVHEVWTTCKDSKSIYASEQRSHIFMMKFIETSHDCVKHRAQARKLYFVGSEGFHPLQDVSLEFIFHAGLALAGVTEEERISVGAFKRVGGSHVGTVPSTSAPSQKSRWKNFSSSETIDFVLEQQSETAPDPSIQSDAMMMALQRKIEPWESMMETDLDFSQSRNESSSRRIRFPLIVVASLISKAPNLGGLCRTCEIFNAELLLVDNLRVREDPAFLVTAVTSEKWMPIQELRNQGDSVKNYLLAQKRLGYKILGIEQATTSQPLETFEFPEKCVLLLGMEKLGIPAQLMPLLDHVLEIAQFGVIRSLNVHVTGALVLYSFARQQQAQLKQ